MTDWMQDEKNRAETQTRVPGVPNKGATTLAPVSREPSRQQKAFYIQNQHADAFELLVLRLKREKGLKGPALAEQAIELLLEHYKMPFDKV